MRKTVSISISIALAFGLSLATSAFAVTVDKNGKCHGDKGQFIACPAKPMQCRDAKGHFAKCGTAGAKPAGLKTTAPVKH